MLADLEKIKASVKVKLRLISASSPDLKLNGQELDSSITCRLISRKLAPVFIPKNEDRELQVLTGALYRAYRGALGTARSYINYFKSFEDVNTNLISRIVEGDCRTDWEGYDNLHSIDQSLFLIESAHIGQSEIREIYSQELIKYGVSLPLDKEKMELVLRLKNPKFPSMSISGMDSLRDFVSTFLLNCWPLFSPIILDLIFPYFESKFNFSHDKMVADYGILKKYGFERLMSRLIILKGVNGYEPAKQCLKNSELLQDSGIPIENVLIIKRYLDGDTPRSKNIYELTDNNPIENAILLSIYVMERKDEFDFLARLVEVHEIDPTITDFLNWDDLHKDVHDVRITKKPNLVFLASILVNKKIRANFKKIANQYGVGGAGADLRKYAMHIRRQTASRSKFLNSFNDLPKNARKIIIRFLLSPGMLDRIANIFPNETEDQSPKGIDSTSATRSLETKRDCLAYARNKYLMPRTEANRLLADVRKNLRQIKYEQLESKGRVKIPVKELAVEIHRWLEPYHYRLKQFSSHANSSFYKAQLKADAYSIAPELCAFICFSNPSERTPNRFAFDIILGSKLRHNFISIQLKDKVDPLLSKQHVSDDVIDDVKDIIEYQIDDFCKDWLTIYEGQKFFQVLNGKLIELMVNWGASNSDDLVELSEQISVFALKRLERKLEEAQSTWLSKYFSELEKDLDEFTEIEEEINQLMKDRLLRELDKGFKESAMWMQLNQAVYPKYVDLRDLIITETFQLKKQPGFRQRFEVEIFEQDLNSVNKPTRRSLLIPGKLVESVVVIIDNLISNACKYSGIGVTTPVSVEIFEREDGISLVFLNKVARDHRSQVHSDISIARIKASEPLDHDALRRRKGTGLHRIRFVCENAMGTDFKIEITDKFLPNGIVRVECFLPIGPPNWTG